ncbi:hypothetical protein VIBHAR_02283 [Vibrio campbellii ATCC BAA-1116]|uniref:Uncharacterized protein n=1 Tax=Vibrio campbellii (strain ATCC BAA-1116) TaxID=2902295 RepID=A7N0S1_VIBC1|nr:hypothetical protein VIBHAR_02283 [Vibrio campbellii ATCC BAA-1116]
MITRLVIKRQRNRGAFLCLKDGMIPSVFKQKLEANQHAYDHGLILIAIVVFLSVLSLIKKSNKDRL